jgi:hypothetical protein
MTKKEYIENTLSASDRACAQLRLAGPFLRPYPIVATTVVDWRWCQYWIRGDGEIVAVEWLKD